MNDLDLDAITTRANAATPGPWTFKHEMVTTLDYDDVLGGNFGGEGGGYAIDSGEGEFIAHAREDVPALVAAVVEARETAVWAQLAADTQKERADKLQAAFDRAPHDNICAFGRMHGLPCGCWKAGL